MLENRESRRDEHPEWPSVDVVSWHADSTEDAFPPRSRQAFRAGVIVVERGFVVTRATSLVEALALLNVGRA